MGAAGAGVSSFAQADVLMAAIFDPTQPPVVYCRRVFIALPLSSQDGSVGAGGYCDCANLSVCEVPAVIPPPFCQMPR